MIEIEKSLLIEALEDNSGMASFYMDKQNGEILMIAEIATTRTEPREVNDKIASDPDRWVKIEPVPPDYIFQIMQDFAKGLPDGENQRLLKSTLLFKNPFANFKNAMLDMPDIRKQWFAYQKYRISKVAEDWLKARGITAQLK